MKFIFAILTLLGGVNATASGFSDPSIELEKAAFYKDCAEKYQIGGPLTQLGFNTVCRCTASRLFQNMPADVTESLSKGDVMSGSVQKYVAFTGKYCLDWVQTRQLSLPPGTFFTYRTIDTEIGRAISTPSPSTNNAAAQGKKLSIDGASCSIDAAGLIKCNNGLTCTRDGSGLVRCNNGLSANTDAGGLTRFSNGSSALTDNSGLTKFSNGPTSSTDSSGLTRFSDGTSCTRDTSGLIRCTKRHGLLD